MQGQGQGQGVVDQGGDGTDQAEEGANKAPKLSSAGPLSGNQRLTKASSDAGVLDNLVGDSGGSKDKEPLDQSNAQTETVQDRGKGGREPPSVVPAAARGSRALAATPRGADEWRRVMLSYPRVRRDRVACCSVALQRNSYPILVASSILLCSLVWFVHACPLLCRALTFPAMMRSP